MGAQIIGEFSPIFRDDVCFAPQIPVIDRITHSFRKLTHSLECAEVRSGAWPIASQWRRLGGRREVWFQVTMRDSLMRRLQEPSDKPLSAESDRELAPRLELGRSF